MVIMNCWLYQFLVVRFGNLFIVQLKFSSLFKVLEVLSLMTNGVHSLLCRAHLACKSLCILIVYLPLWPRKIRRRKRNWVYTRS